MRTNYGLIAKIIQFVCLTTITLLICLQTLAWASIGIAEWQISTPGGNKIGNTDGLPNNVHTAIYQDYSTIYVKNVQEYGFYEGAIAGKAEQGFFLFNEKTKEVNYFPTQEQLCSTIKHQNIRLASVYYFFQLGYLLIRYSLYFLVPFIILFIIHQRLQKRTSFATQVNAILRGKFFALQLERQSSKRS